MVKQQHHITRAYFVYVAYTAPDNSAFTPRNVPHDSVHAAMFSLLKRHKYAFVSVRRFSHIGYPLSPGLLLPDRERRDRYPMIRSAAYPISWLSIDITCDIYVTLCPYSPRVIYKQRHFVVEIAKYHRIVLASFSSHSILIELPCAKHFFFSFLRPVGWAAPHGMPTVSHSPSRVKVFLKNFLYSQTRMNRAFVARGPNLKEKNYSRIFTGRKSIAAYVW
jgi:hypothetical protein